MNRLFKRLLAAGVAVASLLAWPLAATADNTEVSISYGVLPAVRYLSDYHDHWANMNPWGDVVLSIDHSFAPKLWCGLSYTISSASSAKANLLRQGSIVWHSLLFHSRYHYVERGPWAFYGAAGVGVLIAYMQPGWKKPYNRTFFAFQLSPVGVGYRLLSNFELFAEAGFGVQGIVKGGVRVEF